MGLAAAGVKHFATRDIARQTEQAASQPGLEQPEQSFADKADVGLGVYLVGVQLSDASSAFGTIRGGRGAADGLGFAAAADGERAFPGAGGAASWLPCRKDIWRDGEAAMLSWRSSVVGRYFNATH